MALALAATYVTCVTAVFPAVLSAPTLEALNITHHNVELVWRASSHRQGGQLEESPSGSNRLLYTVQEEEVGRGRGFTNIYRYTICTVCYSNVYCTLCSLLYTIDQCSLLLSLCSGYSMHCMATGLSSLTAYRYHIRVSRGSAHGAWSDPLTITTASQYNHRS